MSDLPTLGSIVQLTQGPGLVGQPLGGAGALWAAGEPARLAASLSSAQQRIEELERERDLTYRQWCGRDLMHLPLHEAVGARVAADAAQAEELERALGELVALEDLKKSLAAANHHASRFPTDENYAVIDQLSTDIARRRRPAWHAARALVARGIVSPEGIETQGGSTATPPEPGPAGARPSEAFLRGISPQSAWPFAQDDKGTK